MCPCLSLPRNVTVRPWPHPGDQALILHSGRTVFHFRHIAKCRMVCILVGQRVSILTSGQLTLSDESAQRTGFAHTAGFLKEHVVLGRGVGYVPLFRLSGVPKMQRSTESMHRRMQLSSQVESNCARFQTPTREALRSFLP